MELLGVAQFRSCLFDHARHHQRIESGQIVGLEGKAPAGRYRPGAALFERGVVQERIRAPVQDLLGEHRRDDRVDAVGPYLAGANRLQHLDEASEVHRLGAAVVKGLAHDQVVRDLNRPRDVLLACRKGGEDSRHQVVGLLMRCTAGGTCRLPR